MSDSKELKDLLERLRREAGAPPASAPLPAPERTSEPGPRPAAPARNSVSAGFRQLPQYSQPARQAESRFKAAESKSSWGENKEAFLFGLFSSLLLALGGAFTEAGYLALIGGCGFLIFATVMALALYGHCRAAAAPAVHPGLAERVDALSRRLELLASRPAAAQEPQAGGAGQRELEQKVEELRLMVKSLARAVGGQ